MAKRSKQINHVRELSELSDMPIDPLTDLSLALGSEAVPEITATVADAEATITLQEANSIVDYVVRLDKNVPCGRPVTEHSPKCEGFLVPYSSYTIGSNRHQYFHCGRCGWKPDQNKKVTLLQAQR